MKQDIRQVKEPVMLSRYLGIRKERKYQYRTVINIACFEIIIEYAMGENNSYVRTFAEETVIILNQSSIIVVGKFIL
jgi:hypothetical protein